jgi:putative hydrolase of the HAD superfamily
MGYKHLFFDLDRTLWDFNANSRIALGEVHEHLQLVSVGITDKDEFIARFEEINESLWAAYRLGNIHKKVLRSMRFYKTLEHFGCKDEFLASKMGDMYVEISPKKTNLLPNAINTLDYLAGKYVMHIITNGFEEVQHTKLAHAGLTPYFDLVMTSEMASARKPDPIIFKLAMQKTGANASDSIMIGDDLIADIGGARSLWMDQIFYNPEKVVHSEEVTHEISDLIELKTIL